MTSLALLQLVSPSLPVGAFSYSEGIEWLVQVGKLSNESEVFDWLKGELLRGQVRIEAAVQSGARAALAKWQIEKTSGSFNEVNDLNSWLLALRDASEIRSQHLQMGRSLLQLLKEMGHPLPEETTDLVWPIAWAWAGLIWDLSELEVIQGYLYSWVASQLSAAVRLVPIGPTQAQQIQYKLLPLITSQAELFQNEDPRRLWSGDVGATMAQISHAELYSRLFRS